MAEITSSLFSVFMKLPGMGCDAGQYVRVTFDFEVEASGTIHAGLPAVLRFVVLLGV